MKDQFIPYEQAKMMKELNFTSVQCMRYYDMDGELQHAACFNKEVIEDECAAPLYQQAEEWLWKKHKISVRVVCNTQQYHYVFNEEKRGIHHSEINVGNLYDSPIIAHRQGILKAIEYLHQQSK